MDNPDRSKSVAAIRNRRGEFEENYSKDQIYRRPRTPRDPYWIKNRKLTLNDGQTTFIDGNSGSFLKQILKTDLDKILATGRRIDDIKDSKTETKLLSLKYGRNDSLSLDRELKASRIPITSPRKNIDTCTKFHSAEPSKNTYLQTNLLSLKSTRRESMSMSLDRWSQISRIPITSPRKNLDVSTEHHSPKTRKNKAASLDRETKISRIPIASPRIDIDTRRLKADLKKEDQRFKVQKKISKIPVRNHTKTTGVPCQHEKENEEGVNIKIFPSYRLKRSQIPVLIKRKTEEAKKENEDTLPNPPSASTNISDAYTKKDNQSKTNHTKTAEDFKTNKCSKNSILSPNLIPDTAKILAHSQPTQEPKIKELSNPDTSISGNTNSSLKKSDQHSYEPSQEKIFEHPACQVSMDSSCETRCKRLKKRKDRKRHFKVDETSSDEEQEEKMSSKRKRRIRKRKKPKPKTETTEVIAPEEINVNLKTKTGRIRTDGSSIRICAGAKIKSNIVDEKTLPDRSVAGTEGYPTTNSSRIANSEMVGHSGLNVSSSLSSHLSDAQLTRGGKTVIKFDEQVQLIRHEDLTTEIRPLKIYSGSNLRDFQQLSFVGHVQKTWKRFKNLFKCCACGKEE